MMESRHIILSKMDSYTNGWKRSNDSRYIFLSCYRMMTSNMLDALDRGEFIDQVWVRKLLNRFSDYYFDGLDCYECQTETPEVWRQVHQATQERELHDIQCLLMGVNAHINYDLVLTVHELLQENWVSLSPELQKSRYSDYTKVNEIIAGTIDQVQDELLEPDSLVLKMLDVTFGRLDEYLISRIVSDWREDVWNNAMQLISIGEASEKEDYRIMIESQVLKRGALMGRL